MLSSFWTLEFEAVEKGEMLSNFQMLSFEAVEKEEMLSVFQIMFSGKPQGGGECCPFFPKFSWSGRLEKRFWGCSGGLRGGPWRAPGRVLGGSGGVSGSLGGVRGALGGARGGLYGALGVPQAATGGSRGLP